MAGIVVHPLDEVPLALVNCVICRAEDFDEIDVVCLDLRDCLRGLLAFAKEGSHQPSRLSLKQDCSKP